MIKLIIASVVSAFVLLCIGFAIWATVVYHNSQHNCVQIENLKRNVRAGALQDYKHLPKTVRLLHLQLTPEIRATAKANLARTLKVYAPDKCHGFFG